MNPVIIIPAHNPPLSFTSLLRTIHTISTMPIIVVDDGSFPIIRLENSNNLLLRNNYNRGKGFSLLRGFHEAINRGYSHAITLDADSQHDPNYIQSFIEVDENICIVLGIRDRNNKMPIHRKISNKITSSIISLICQQKISDSQCGFRRYKLDNVCSKTYNEPGFQFESEVLIKLLRNNDSLYNINVPTIYQDEKSNMSNFWDTIRFIRLIARYLINIK